jgi:TolB-like protein/class 3 adenylate cyclase/cytochrome c-type biogenesis protein CcmH/NrfG
LGSAQIALDVRISFRAQIRGTSEHYATFQAVIAPGGTMSQQRVKRRLEAILFADVVGYARVVGQAEVDTLHRLRDVLWTVVRPQVQAHAGRIVKIKGDGILAEFPSAVEAVAGAVALQQAMAERNAVVAQAERIELRIGVNLGDIVANDNDIHGDVVNIACRIEPLADPGGICVSATVHEHVRGKLAYPFENRGEQALKNIASPVRIYSLGRETIARLPRENSASDGRTRSWRWYATALAVGLLCVAMLWMYLGPSEQTISLQTAPAPLGSAAQPGDPRGAPPLSIVVLPFTNAGHDADQEYFADGITEDLTTDLSRIPGAFVIAPATAFRYKGKGTDVRQVGRELAVRYALQGSARRIADSVRINAQLVDTSNAAQLWAERFDGEVVQLAKVHDQVTHGIAGALKAALTEAENQRVLRERPNNPDAVDLTMRGWALLNKGASRESTLQARQLLEAALRLSPDHLPALNGLAQAMLIQWQSTWYARSSEEHLKELDHVVDRALAVQPDDALASYHRGYVLKRRQKDLNQALAAFERAIALDPNLAVAHNYLGQIKVFLGRSNEAAEHTLKAIQLSPHDPQLALWYYQLALTYIHEQRYDEAVQWARRGLQVNPNVRYTYRVLAAALALSGRVDEAKRAAAEMLRRYPGESISTFLTREPWPNAKYRAGQNREITGMRLAGIPE